MLHEKQTTHTPVFFTELALPALALTELGLSPETPAFLQPSPGEDSFFAHTLTTTDREWG